ncbi:hypothetical protein HanXRQr2_Chr11g0519891 [Helianthus annuus]|uniref:Uncharacterized protein n=1 Tax=Helianthus annuus TaxID=4232 RepID=A0A9K3HU96_HELAN|nr:hypothetical protein HanXRQr2_Chr11g0519891 [Helianthus annuus]
MHTLYGPYSTPYGAAHHTDATTHTRTPPGHAPSILARHTNVTTHTRTPPGHAPCHSIRLCHPKVRHLRIRHVSDHPLMGKNIMAVCEV